MNYTIYAILVPEKLGADGCKRMFPEDIVSVEIKLFDNLKWFSFLFWEMIGLRIANQFHHQIMK